MQVQVCMMFLVPAGLFTSVYNQWHTENYKAALIEHGWISVHVSHDCNYQSIVKYQITTCMRSHSYTSTYADSLLQCRGPNKSWKLYVWLLSMSSRSSLQGQRLHSTSK